MQGKSDFWDTLYKDNTQIERIKKFSGIWFHEFKFLISKVGTGALAHFTDR